MDNPRLILLTGPASSGKTETALQHLAQPGRGRAIVLVSGGVQRRYIKQRVQGQRRVGVHQFNSLARLILRGVQPELTDMSGITRTLLLRRVLRELAAAGRLPRFASVAHKPGFVSTLGDLISEAQQAMLTPGALAAAGVTPYDGELDAIYTAYCASVEKAGLVDTARRLELARETLRSSPRLLTSVSLLIVDGFDQFTRLQLGLLAELTRHIGRTMITLTWEADDRPTQRRFIRTRHQLLAALPPMQVERCPPPPDFRPPADVLVHISRHLFNLDPPAERPPAAGSVQLIEAADRERELRAVLRQVRSLLDAGAPAEQVALLLRSGSRYGPLLREIAAEYDLPLAMNEGLPLIESPYSAALLMLLRLPLDAYPARAVGEVWRSCADGRLTPFTGEQPLLLPELSIRLDEAASLLEHAAYDTGLSRELPRLYEMLQKLAEVEPLVDEEDPRAAPISPAAAAQTRALLEALAAWLQPPEQATIAEYAAWVRARIIETRRLSQDEQEQPLEESAAGGDDPRSQVYRRWSSLLDELAAAARLLNEPAIDYPAFIAELSAALRAARYGSTALEAGRVTVLSVLAARGLHFDHVIVPGMSDGEFPQKLPAPPLYSRRERVLLARRGVPLIPPDPADERSLFYEAAARAWRSLVLTRTYLDEAGNPLHPSPYIAAVCNLLAAGSVASNRIRAGSVPTLNEAVSPQEKLIALMESMNSGEQPPATASAPPLFEHIQRACRAERERESEGAYGAFDGLLEDGKLIAALARRFGPAYQWSATQFNDYITCPFRFFAAHVLRLRPRGQPEEGLERIGRGRIYHDILARAGLAWRAAGLPLTPENEQAILDMLRAAADESFASITTHTSFLPGPFWQWEQADVRHRLERAIRQVLHTTGSDWAAFRVASIERSFGGRSGTPPLAMTTADGPVLIGGRIDRLDQRDDGALVLIDYKSSATPPPPGRDHQRARCAAYDLSAGRRNADSPWAARGARHLSASGQRPAQRPADRPAARRSAGCPTRTGV